MIKFKEVNLHLILGIIVGLIISGFIIVEGSWVYYTLITNGITIDVVKFNRLVIIIAVIFFITSIVVFNSKKLKKINLNKISSYLLISVLMSIVGSIIFILIVSKLLGFLYSDGEITILDLNIVVITMFIGSILSFIIIFLLLVNKKVAYIKFLTKEVKIIKDEGFGKTITVKGKDELAELCESINSMSVELKEKIDNEKIIEKNKNELITNVSHDLRTPLTSIIGYVDLIKKNDFKDIEKISEYINVIDERSKNLNNLINELFEYTKLNSHDIKLNKSEVEITGLIEQIVGEYVYRYEKAALYLEKDIIDKDISVFVDIEKIVRAIENLLTNAMKYSVIRSKVVVKLEEEKNNLVFSISNETKDISKDDLDNIFERFYKVDKSRKNSESTGLGLSIVKRIVELHEGSIEVGLVNSIITFKIRLPYSD
ncbi:MAG: sensor histidine kinase [Clostridium sp.]